MNRFTISLGELRLAKYDLGNKADLLDMAALRNLSDKGIGPTKKAVQMRVPRGGVVLHEFYEHAIATGLAVREGDEIKVPDPASFLSQIELPPITGRIAVRSAFTAEDKSDISMAGAFESVLNVPIESFDVSPSRVRNPGPVAEAVARVWSSGLKKGVAGRLDVLVMEMVDAKFAGVAFTESDYEDDLVNYTEGLAADMLAGKVEGSTLELPKLDSIEGAGGSYHSLPFVPRLQVLLRSIRLAFGGGDWDVEWADDGTEIWLIQLRPITAPTIRNEVFVYGPLKEALPELPSRFMSSLIESCGQDIFDFYREVDQKLPSERKYIEVFYGRPMMNASLLTDLARRWGLPTSSVTDVIGKVPVNERSANKRRMFKTRSQRFALRAKCLRAIGESRQVAAEIAAVASNPGATLTEVVESARLAYTMMARQMIALREAIGINREIRGVKTIGSQMYVDLEPLRQIVQANPALALAVSKGEVPRDADFRHRWEAWLKKHGHRAMYETDLARPRFREAQADILRMLGTTPVAVPQSRRTPFSALQMRSPSARATHARENLRFEAMAAFEKIRRRLLELALPKGVTEEMFWSLSIDEVRQLDRNWRPSSEFVAERRAEMETLAAMRVPDVLRRNDPIDLGRNALHGIGLSRGEATGRAWILRNPTTQLPEGYSPHNTILVAPSVDAGWIPTFSLVAGVVIEAGGTLSHGSIILRELGIPAVTSVGGATHDIKSGQKLRIAAASGRVDILG